MRERGKWSLSTDPGVVRATRPVIVSVGAQLMAATCFYGYLNQRGEDAFDDEAFSAEGNLLL